MAIPLTRVKICGCRTPEQALWAAAAGADFVGVVFATSSRRRVGLEDASEILRALGPSLRDLEQPSPPASSEELPSWFQNGASILERLLERKRPLTVGVFAGNDPDEVNEIVDECGIDLIQLSGGEPWTSCLMANRQIIKAVHVRRDDSPESLAGRIETGSAMAILLDKADEVVYGGTGKPLDWQVAAGVASQMPVWLAGGLTPENVAIAIETVRPWCVDVSSGVETNGVKDKSKVRAFIKAAKAEP
jgi:anthranilate synthase/indole-3-glycerol phosphate synthase/phosphoribosylanthranilate isomerase